MRRASFYLPTVYDICQPSPPAVTVLKCFEVPSVVLNGSCPMQPSYVALETGAGSRCGLILHQVLLPRS